MDDCCKDGGFGHRATGLDAYYSNVNGKYT